MSLRDSQFGELKVPLAWTAAVALVVAGVVAVTLLLSDRRQTFEADAYGQTRTMADKAFAPVGDVLATPGRWTGAGIQSIGGYFFAVSENRRLKAELKEMRQWRDVAIALRDTNERYRSLLGLQTDPPIPMVAARIVTDSRGPFANSRLANAGSDRGVKNGQPVMSENGLVGRVVGVSKGMSRVLLLTDVASRTPVMVDRTNARAILSGDGGPNPRLDYLRGRDAVKEGDRIFTSGDGGLFPRGLPVGVAVKGVDGRWRVVQSADRAPVDFVRILLFADFTQVLDHAGLDKMPPPPPPTAGLPPELTQAGAQPTGAAAGTTGQAPAAPTAPIASGQLAPRAPAPAARPPTGAAPATPVPRPAAPAATAPRATATTPRPAAQTPVARPAQARPAPARPAQPRPAAPTPTITEEPPH